jgi:hypothetical protein
MERFFGFGAMGKKIFFQPLSRKSAPGVEVIELAVGNDFQSVVYVFKFSLGMTDSGTAESLCP